MRFLILLLALLPISAFAQNGTKISTASYSHATIGTTAGDAILAANVHKTLLGWTICHDAGSANVYLAFSTGADPDTDGTRLGPNTCFTCETCGYKTLADLNVKGSAAGTNYSIVQYK